MERKNVSSGAAWEPMVGYSRAVRMGPFVFVAGTTAADAEGRIMATGDAYGQAKFILEKIGRAHAELFRDIRPAATMVEVSRLVAPEALVEIEVDAIASESA